MKELKINKRLENNLLKNKENIQLNNFKNWDSMKHVRILVQIEKEFKIRIDEKNQSFFNDFQSGASYIKKINPKL